MSSHSRLAGCAAAALCCFLGTAQAQDASDAFGSWRHPDNGSIVRIYKCTGNNLCAAIVGTKDGQTNDVKNPDPKLRNRPIKGLEIMRGASQTGPASWSGDIYNRSDGVTYRGSVTVKSRRLIELSGCSKLFGFICKTVQWSRVGK